MSLVLFAILSILDLFILEPTNLGDAENLAT